MGKLAAISTVVLVLAVSVAYLPQQQRQYILHDALDPARSWASAQYKGLEEVLQRAGLPHALPLEPIQAKLQQAASTLRALLKQDHKIQEAAPTCQTDEVAACRMSGKVAHCGCDYASVERLNKDHLFPVLTKLVEQPFFRFFKVNLYCDCPFWPDAGMCFQRDCCVTECEENEIPEAWREQDKLVQERREQLCEGEAHVDRRMDPAVTSQLSSITDWHGLNNPWVPGDDAGVDYIYVDLRRNPEKYTGYKGEDAHRVWSAIYDQSALREAAAVVAATRSDGHAASAAVPDEQVVLYRLISGMHTAITTSIVHNFYNEATGTWGPNLPLFKARLATPAAKSHLENLYFTLLFVLRAVTKAGPTLSSFDYNTGQPEADARTEQLVRALVSDDALRKACPSPFDEGLLWRSEGSEILAKELQSAFHNITRVMDCVGCEKCKMHGKLNILGIASAMKVLFSVPPPPPGISTTACADPHLILDRNEVIALMNLLAKLSKSVEAVRELSLQLEQ